MDIVLKSQVSQLLFDDLYSRFTRVMDRYGYQRMQSAVIQNSGVKQRIKSQFLTLYQQMTTMNSMPNKYGFPVVVKSLLSLCEDFRLHYLPLPVTHRSAHSSSLCFHQVTFRQLFSQEMLGCLSDVIAVLKLFCEVGEDEAHDVLYYLIDSRCKLFRDYARDHPTMLPLFQKREDKLIYYDV